MPRSDLGEDYTGLVNFDLHIKGSRKHARRMMNITSFKLNINWSSRLITSAKHGLNMEIHGK